MCCWPRLRAPEQRDAVTEAETPLAFIGRLCQSTCHEAADLRVDAAPLLGGLLQQVLHEALEAGALQRQRVLHRLGQRGVRLGEALALDPGLPALQLRALGELGELLF